MTETTIRRQCPYLGLAADRALIHTEPSRGHRCYAVDPLGAPELAYQAQFCLSVNHPTCHLYQAAVAEDAAPQTAPSVVRRRAAPRESARWRRYLLWGGLALLLGAVVLFYWLDLSGRSFDSLFQPGAPSVAIATPGAATDLPTPVVAGTPTAAPRPTTSATPSPGTDLAVAQPVAAEAARPNTPTSEPGGRVVTLNPQAGEAGWWGSNETRGNHLGDSYLYAGYYGGQAFVAAARFDLTQVPRGAPLRDAAVYLTGLETDRFDPAAGGTWSLQLVADESLPDYARADFQAIFNAPAAAALFPTLYPADLGKGGVNILPLDATARAWLEKQILAGAPGVIVRMIGPGSGDTLFAWDSGAGSATIGEGPQLVLNLGALPPTVPPLPTEAVIVATLTSTPENVLTAAADAWTATAVAETIGTYTPLPYRAVTPTSLPANLATAQANALLAGLPPIVPHTPTPGNEATATADAIIASAYAFLTGTPTATPQDAVTPVIILPTAQPENVMTEAARSVSATIEAGAGVNPTPWPYNAILATVTPAPLVITYTPPPANRATAAYQEAVATAVAFLYGTYTPLPPNVVTPTPQGRVPAPPAPLVLPPPITPTPVSAPPPATPTTAPPSTATPSAPGPTPTLDPLVPAAQLAQVMSEANDALVALLTQSETSRERLQSYFCGAAAWRKVTAYLDTIDARADRPTGATYTTGTTQAPIQDPDSRWRLEQSETWSYTLPGGGQQTSRERYTYWLVATATGTPPFCIDDYAFSAGN